MSEEAQKPVLLIDDDEGLCILVANHLKEAGISPAVARSGAEALAWLDGNTPQLILLDLTLPDMDGRELLAVLAGEGREIPYVVISGMSDVRVAVELMREGAIDFLPKDQNMLELVAPVVERAISRLRSEQLLAETELRFRQLAENIEDVFWMADSGLERFYYVSPASLAVLGVAESEVLREPAKLFGAAVEEDRPKIGRFLDRLPSASGKDEIIFRVQAAAGVAVSWVRCRVFPVPDPGGVGRYAGIMTDITAQKNLERRVLEVADEERMRIGQDIHDDLCQRLAAMKMKCGVFERALAEQQHHTAGEIGAISGELAEATALSRKIARGLSPVTLEADGLMAALQALAETSSSRYGIRCELLCGEPVVVDDPTVATHLFRIAQELVTNAAKHAAPSEIKIALSEDDGLVTLEVENDGAPYPGEGFGTDGMGMNFLNFRSDAIGATIRFSGRPDGEGTTASCTWDGARHLASERNLALA